MKLNTIAPEACHLYKIPYTQDTANHWEFYWRGDFVNRNLIAIISEETHAIDCNGVETLIDNPTYAICGGVGSQYQVHLKNFNINLVEDVYIRWKIVFDDLVELTLYSDWFRREHCHVSVGIFKPCLEVEETGVDINGDFVGHYDFDYVNIYAPILAFPPLPRPTPTSFYSPQLYLRCGKFIQSGFEYEMKKVAKKITKVTKNDNWTLDTEEVGSNYMTVVHSVLGYATIYDFTNERIFDIEEMTIPLKDKYMKHKYYTINAVAKDTKSVVKPCSAFCWIAQPTS